MQTESIHPSSEILFLRCCFHISQQIKEVKLLAACEAGAVGPWSHIKMWQAVASVPPLHLKQEITSICIFINYSLFTSISDLASCTSL